MMSGLYLILGLLMFGAGIILAVYENILFIIPMVFAIMLFYASTEEDEEESKHDN